VIVAQNAKERPQTAVVLLVSLYDKILFLKFFFKKICIYHKIVVFLQSISREKHESFPKN